MSFLPLCVAVFASLWLTGCSTTEGTDPTPKSVGGADASTTESAKPWLEGRVVDEQGQPVVGVTVRVYAGFATRWQIGSTRTDERGRFVFNQRADGASRIGDGLRDDYVGVCVGDHDLPWKDVRIPAGGTGTVELVFDRNKVGAAQSKEERGGR